MGGPIDQRTVAVLGVLTICAYGSWYYAFGVLLEPIKLDTGWKEGSLAASFSAGTVLIGLSAIFGGRLLDRVGHRPVFLLGAAVSGGGLLLAASATNVVVFGIGAATGLAAAGSLGFYPVTMTTAVRLNPDAPSRAIATLTIWGAFASVIFLPLVNVLTSQLGWRPTVRLLALATASAFVLAALALPPTELAVADQRPSVAEIMRSTLRAGAPRWFTAATALGGLSMSTMLVFQVPAMTAAGLGAGTAASLAGLRGFCQLGGRLPLTMLVNRLGTNGALTLAFGAMATGGAILALARSVPLGAAFAVIAGFGIGAFSPLQGMKGEELFPRDQLGATMGFYGAVLLLAGSPGPVLGGVLTEQTGDARWTVVIVVAAALGALGATVRMNQAARSTAATQPSKTLP